MAKVEIICEAKDILDKNYVGRFVSRDTWHGGLFFGPSKKYFIEIEDLRNNKTVKREVGELHVEFVYPFGRWDTKLDSLRFHRVGLEVKLSGLGKFSDEVIWPRPYSLI